MTLLKNSAEGGNDGTPTSNSNSGPPMGTAWTLVSISAGSTFAYTTTSPIHGGTSYLNSSTTAATTPLVDWGDTAATSAAARVYLRFASLPDALMQIGINFRGNAGATSLARTEFNITTGAMRSIMGASTGSFSGSTPTIGTVYRLEVVCTGFNGASGAMTSNLYVGDSLTPFSTATVSGATTAFTCDHTRFGKFSTTGNWSWTLDDMAANIGASSEIGPEITLTSGWTSGYEIRIG